MKSTILFVILFLSLIPALYGGELQLHVATEHWEPYSYLDKQDNVVKGSATAVVRLVLEKAGIPYDIRVYPWARAYQMAQTKENVLIFAMTRTTVREPLFQWIGQVAKSDNINLYKLKKRKDITVNSLEDVKQYNIGVIRESESAQVLESKGFTQLTKVNKQANSIKQLELSRIDLLVISETSLVPEFKLANVSVDIVEKVMVLIENRPYMALSKQTSEVIAQILRKAYTDLVQEGKIKH